MSNEQVESGTYSVRQGARRLGISPSHVVATMLYLIWRGFSKPEIDVFPSLLELMKIAVIPIVTFVFCYYYGSKQS